MWQRHKVVLASIIENFESRGIPYQVTGGIAGNVHGSTWPPHDIDLEIGAADFETVAKLFDTEMIQPPHHFLGEEFDLWLMTLSIDGIDVDINSAEECYLITKDGRRVLCAIDLGKSERLQFLGLELMVQPLEDLIAYKQLIGRTKDVADLSALRAPDSVRHSE